MKKILSILLALCMLLSCLAGCTREAEQTAAVSPTPETAADSGTSLEGYNPAPAFPMMTFPYAGTWSVGAVIYNDSLVLLSDNAALKDLYDTCVIIFEEDCSFLYINTFFHEGTVRELKDSDSEMYVMTTSSIYTHDFKDGELTKKESTSGSVEYYIVAPTDLEGEEALMFVQYDEEQKKALTDEIVLLFVRGYESSTPTYSTTPEATPLPTVPFTNKYGTATTKCAKSGCNNYIASSGDTNCCTAHSNKCLNCGCYIDGDAMYCMSCLSGSKSTASYSTPKPTKKPSYSSSSEKCQYKDFYGNVCGASCTDYKNLCNKHFNELYSTYQSLTGG